MFREPQLVLKDLLKHIAPMLKDAGFKRRGSTWHRQGEGVVVVVNVQKDRHNTAKSVRFTINLGVFTPRLDDMRKAIASDPPSHTDCALRKRIGFLMPERADKWWEITAWSREKSLCSEIADVVERHVLPWCAGLGSEAALRDHWLTHRAGGELLPGELIMVAQLVRDLGPQDLLPELVVELESKLAEMPDYVPLQRWVPILKEFLE